MSLFVPWAMQRRNDSLAGFEPEVAARVAMDLGVSPVYHVLDWDELLPALASDRIDVIIAGMTVTPARAKQVAFTKPYASSEIKAAVGSRVGDESAASRTWTTGPCGSGWCARPSPIPW